MYVYIYIYLCIYIIYIYIYLYMLQTLCKVSPFRHIRIYTNVCMYVISSKDGTIIDSNLVFQKEGLYKYSSLFD